MVALELPMDSPRARTAFDSHALIETYPKHDPTSAHRLLVPKGWLQTTRIGGVRFEPGRPYPTGFFTAPANPGEIVIAITQARIPVEIGIEDYLRAQAAFEGWQIFEAKWVDYPSGRRLDMGFSKMSKKVQHVRRTTAFADHGRIIRHDAFCPVSRWRELADDLWLSGASFELVAPAGNPRFERWERHRHRELVVEIPESWGVEPKHGDAAALDARLMVRGRLCGYVRVKMERVDDAPAVEHLLEVSDRELRKGDMTPARRKPAVLITPGAELEGWLGTFCSEARVPGGALVHVWYGYKFCKGTLCSMMAVSEPLEKDRLGYLRTKRAFDIAGETATEGADDG